MESHGGNRGFGRLYVDYALQSEVREKTHKVGSKSSAKNFHVFTCYTQVNEKPSNVLSKENDFI